MSTPTVQKKNQSGEHFKLLLKLEMIKTMQRDEDKNSHLDKNSDCLEESNRLFNELGRVKAYEKHGK